MAWEGERGGFFALVTAGRIRDRFFFLIDSPQKNGLMVILNWLNL